jgi:hypothetical protein
MYDFPKYTMLWEHQVGCGVGMNGRSWGIWFSGSEGTLVLDDQNWEIIPEPKKKSLEAIVKPGGADARPAHVRNFLDCVRSRQAPVENLELGHFVSSVAHLGNIAFRTKKKIIWDARQQQIVNDNEANRLISVKYRKPWNLPYLKG